MPHAMDGPLPAGDTRHAAKFQRILDAALTLFAAKGFHGTKISEVARAAGVADGTIYLYFKNKTDLMASLLDSTFDTLAADLRRCAAAHTSARSKFLYVIDHHIGLAKSQPKILAFVRHEIHGGHAPWRTHLRGHGGAYLQEWANIIDAGRAKGDFSPHIDSDVLVQLLFGAVDHACAIWARQNEQATSVLGQIGEQMRRFAMLSLSEGP